MRDVYVVGDGSRTEAMKRVWCKDENRELQRLLKNNADLLPGEQIDPDDPRRWIFVKDEFPVPDPANGVDKWSIDLVFLDHDAIPTFVECKRFKDTRTRREVVGQMLEYAANGHHYWTGDQLRAFAQESAAKVDKDFEEIFAQLRPTDDLEPEEFFEKAEENLRAGRVRLVFFLEDSPYELRSVVEFLNRQMEQTEVLVVEARQYEGPGQRVVVPVLFGYTEQARIAKKSVVSTPPRKKWDASLFFADAEAKKGQTVAAALRELYDAANALGCDISWGSGAVTGTFNIKEPSICERSFLTAASHGGLQLNFGWLKGTELAEAFRDRLRDLVTTKLHFELKDDYRERYVTVRQNDWLGKKAEVVAVIKNLVEGARAEAEKV